MSKKTTIVHPRILSQEDHEQEQLLKFFIGLRLLGEEKQVRYLNYLRQLLKNTHQREREKENDHSDSI